MPDCTETRGGPDRAASGNGGLGLNLVTAYRNGVQLPALDAHRVWRAHKKGETVVLQALTE